ncbi:MAG TPA: protease modulator HflK [Sedimentisphaerales bacterium]|nr:protease modulator HflK [Sedimentisphaerales bacterium]
MTEQNQEYDLQPQEPQGRSGDELDAAGRSLSEALRISFVILKVIMIVLVLVFLASGFRTVGSDERALVLRLGKIRGVLEPGPHWVFPYPIEEIVRIPVAKRLSLPIDSFWYFLRPDEMLPQGPKTRIRVEPTLDPTRDGYCITRSEKQSETGFGASGSDYNIVHGKWQLIYQIDDATRFFKNVYVEDVKPGQDYFNVITKSITPLLQAVFEDAVVTAMVNYTIDEAISNRARIPEHVKKLLQEKLDTIESGIRVVSVLTNNTWPRQVDQAFQASVAATQASQQAVSEARTYAEKTLSEAAGPVAEELFAVLKGKTVSRQDEEFLWDSLAGEGREKIAQARAYKTGVVESARANAEYLKKILPEYNKRPKLVMQRIYLDAIESVLNNAYEKFVIQPVENSKGAEIRVLVNRDPTIKRQSEEQ